MGGVDRSDQMISYSNTTVKSFKWWKKVIFHIFAIAVLNAYTIFKEENPNSNILHRVFRRKLISELISDNPSHLSVKAGRPRVNQQQLERLTSRHFITKIVGVGKKRDIARLCTVCNNAERSMAREDPEHKRKRPGHETKYECKDCNVPLCIEPCFMLYHSHQEYILAYKRWKCSNQVPED